MLRISLFCILDLASGVSLHVGKVKTRFGAWLTNGEAAPLPVTSKKSPQLDFRSVHVLDP